MKYATKSNTDQTSKHTATRSKATTVVSHGSDAVAQRKMANAVSNSPQMVTQREVAASIHQSPQMTALRESSNVLPVQCEADSGGAANTTGLPDGLKAGIESMSGISMDNVNVHYNSDKPAQLQALAHTQGTDIHVAPGQEKHLPHEAWHVVQQAQGRVKATMQMKGVGVNDDAGLEHEADVMGAKAASFSGQSQSAPETREVARGAAAPVQCMHMMTDEEHEALNRVLVSIHDQGEGIDTSGRKPGTLIGFMHSFNPEETTPQFGKSPAFWTGPGSREAAEANPNATTLGDTAAGKAVAGYVDSHAWAWDHSAKAWTRSSENYANAVGQLYGKNGKYPGVPVYAYISTQANKSSIYFQKEKPILVAAGVNLVEKDAPYP